MSKSNNQKPAAAAQGEELKSPIVELANQPATEAEPAPETATDASAPADAPAAPAEPAPVVDGAAQGDVPADTGTVTSSAAEITDAKEEAPAPVVTEEKPAVTQGDEDITAPAATTEETQETAQEEAPAEPLTPEQEVLAHIQTILPNVTEFSLDVKGLIIRMEQFAATMGPRNITTPEVGAAKQRQLYNDILHATRLADWQIALEVILYYFKKYRKAHFDDRMLLRFMDVIRFNRRDMMCFSSLVHLFAIGADPKGRSIVAQQVDFNKLAEMLPDDTARERLLTLFKF